MPRISLPTTEAEYARTVDLYQYLSTSRPIPPAAAPLPDLSTIPRRVQWGSPPTTAVPTSTPAPVSDLPQYYNVMSGPPNSTTAPASTVPPRPVQAAPSTPLAQIPTTAEPLSSPPSSFGQGAAAAAPAGAAAAVITFGAGVISGANPTDAAFQGVGAGAGTVAGSALGGLTGPAAPLAVPVLSAVGGLAGAAAGGAIADLLFAEPEQTPRPVPQPVVLPAPAGFSGGQCRNVEYTIRARVTGYDENGVDGSILIYEGTAIGPIRFDFSNFRPGSHWVGGYDPHPIVIAPNEFRLTQLIPWSPNHSDAAQPIGKGAPSVGQIAYYTNVEILSVVPTNSSIIDNCGNPAPNPLPFPQQTRQTPAENAYVLQGSPTQAPPSSLPLFLEPGPPPRLQLGVNLAPAPSDPASQQNPSQPYTLTFPGGQPVTISAPGTPPFTFTPPGNPITIGVPSNVNPSGTPSGTPLSTTSPTGTPQSFGLPGNGPVTITLPGQQPIVFDPTGQTPPQGVTPNPLIPNAFTPTPLTPGAPLTSPPLTTTPLTPVGTPSSPSSPPLISNQQAIIDTLLGIGIIVSGIRANTTPNAIQRAAAAGTCSTLQPGGCMAPIANNAEGANNNARQANNNIVAANANINDLSDTIGKTEYPVLVPSTFITDKTNPNPSMQTIPNLTSFMGWQTRRMDELFGQFSVPLEFKPSPNLPGVSKEIPNVAEGIGEIYGSQLHAATQMQTLINLTTRALIEVGQNKQQIFKTYTMTQSIMDYLGFAYSEKNHQVPMLFKPGEGDLFSMLTEHEQDIKGVETKKGESLRRDLQKLLEAAAIIKAIFWRKIDTKGTDKEIQDRVTDTIKKSSKLNKNINKKEKDNQGKDAFDKFLDEAEVGFKDTPGVTNTTEPYGDAFDNRPKIKRIPKQPPTTPS